MESFYNYLYYAPRYDVFKDYNLWIYMKASCKFDDTGQRWVNELEEYKFLFPYKTKT